MLPFGTLENILAMILVLGALIFFHEMGHFILARRAGILCREFALGMGPKIISRRRGETMYSLRALPIGGYVKMAGEDPEMVEVKTGQKVGLRFGEDGTVQTIVLNRKKEYEDLKIVKVSRVDLEKDMVLFAENEEEQRERYDIDPQAMIVQDGKETQVAPLNRQFSGKTLGQRFWTIIAGPAANFVLAFVLFFLFAQLGTLAKIDTEVGEVIPDSPAAEAGLQNGDRIVSVEGQSVRFFFDMSRIVGEAAGDPLSFSVRRDGETMNKTITPEANEQGVGKIGVYQATDAYGLKTTYDYTGLILKTLGMLVTGQVSFEDLAGPVGIYDMTGKVAQSGWFNLIQWSAVLSINLGIINLLPIPALDGGRLLFLGVEALRGKPMDPNKEGLVHFVGFAFLILLMIVITWNDIQRIFY